MLFANLSGVSEDRCASDVTIDASTELRETRLAEVPTSVPRASNDASTSVSAADLPPDLARLAATWDRLPEAVKVGLLVFLNAAGGGDGYRPAS